MKKLVFTALACAICAGSQTIADETVHDQFNSSKGVGSFAITGIERNPEKGFGGYFDTEFVLSDDVNTFKAHRLILEYSNQIHERILFNSEIEYEYGGLVNAGTDDGEIKIEQLWADYSINDSAIFRMGAMIVPFGKVNTLHDSDYRDTTNKPIYNRYIVPGTWVDTGVAIHGNWDVNDEWAVNYIVAALNGLSDSSSVGSGTSIADGNGLRSGRASFKADNNKNKALVGRVGVSPALGYEIGASFYTGDYNDSGDKGLTMLGLDAEAKFGAFELVGEFAVVNLDEDTTAGVPSEMNGYFVEARYHFFPDFLRESFLGDGFKNPEFTLFARYGAVDTDTSVTNVNDRTQTTFGMNYRPVPTTAFKVEYEINKEEVTDSNNNAFVASVAVGF
jgi:hypothetical protein